LFLWIFKKVGRTRKIKNRKKWGIRLSPKRERTNPALETTHALAEFDRFFNAGHVVVNFLSERGDKGSATYTKFIDKYTR